MRLTIRPTLRDVMELNCSIREQRIRGWCIMLTGAGGLCFAAVWGFFIDGSRDPTPVVVGSAVILLIGAIATRLAGLGAWLIKTPKAAFEVEVSQAGVTFLG